MMRKWLGRHIAACTLYDITVQSVNISFHVEKLLWM